MAASRRDGTNPRALGRNPRNAGKQLSRRDKLVADLEKATRAFWKAQKDWDWLYFGAGRNLPDWKARKLGDQYAEKFDRAHKAYRDAKLALDDYDWDAKGGFRF